MNTQIFGAAGLRLLLLPGSTPTDLLTHDGRGHGYRRSGSREREDSRWYDPRSEDGTRSLTGVVDRNDRDRNGAGCQRSVASRGGGGQVRLESGMGVDALSDIDEIDVGVKVLQTAGSEETLGDEAIPSSGFLTVAFLLSLMMAAPRAFTRLGGRQHPVLRP